MPALAHRSAQLLLRARGCEAVSSALGAAARTTLPASAAAAGAKRTFSSLLPTLRPTAVPTSSPSATLFFALRRPRQGAFSPFVPTTAEGTEAGAAVVDLVPRGVISTHPALGQLRCGPRPTMARSSRLIQKRRHGFLSRARTAKGRKMLARRRAKGRLRLSA